jgi:hypothetical protein
MQRRSGRERAAGTACAGRHRRQHRPVRPDPHPSGRRVAQSRSVRQSLAPMQRAPAKRTRHARAQVRPLDAAPTGRSRQERRRDRPRRRSVGRRSVRPRGGRRERPVRDRPGVRTPSRRAGTERGHAWSTPKGESCVPHAVRRGRTPQGSHGDPCDRERRRAASSRSARWQQRCPRSRAERSGGRCATEQRHRPKGRCRVRRTEGCSRPGR